MSSSHNLDIQSYSLGELFQLLDLPPRPTKEQMFQAKKKVLMFHPDKSHLPDVYFIFYKKAYEISLKYYQEQNKQDCEITAENTTYRPLQEEDDPLLRKNIQKKSSEKSFHSTFNQLFEKNMIEKTENRNEWFSEEAPVFTPLPKDSSVTSKNMGTVFETLKEKNQSMIVHKGVQTIYSPHGGNRLYDEADSNEYISSDPFGKLKYDDLRKVHKDQTIFAVGESDFKNVTKYESENHYRKERDSQPMTPLEKKEAEKLLAEKELALQHRYAQQLHQSELKTMKYEDKNKKIMSTFLHLEN
jgi:hypothetical protein